MEPIVSTPTTTYRGHTIQWSDNSDKWVCYDLSDKVRSSPKLSLIKAAIDRLYLTERKNKAVQCYELSTHGQRVESNVVEYLGEKVHRSWGSKPEITDHKVAVVAQRHGSERPSRRETTLDKLMPVTPEAEDAYQRYERLNAEAKAAGKRADDAFKAIPRLKPYDVRALIELYGRDA